MALTGQPHRESRVGRDTPPATNLFAYYGYVPTRTLHLGLRVAELDRSLAFYTAVGYEIVGEVPETGMGHLTMLKLPGDEFVTIRRVLLLVADKDVRVVSQAGELIRHLTIDPTRDYQRSV